MDAAASSVVARTPERRAGAPRARCQFERGDEAEVDAAAPWAVQGGHLGVARVLLEHGADASTKTKHKLEVDAAALGGGARAFGYCAGVAGAWRGCERSER